jgi:hypothetical protein
MDMISSRHLFGITTLLAVLVCLAPAATAGDVQAPTTDSVTEGHGTTEPESEAHATAEHEYHVNHFGGFMGSSTHLDTDESGFTLGLEYARQFHPRWAVVGYTELISGSGERDIIFCAGIIFYPISRVGLVFGPGLEFAEKDVEHHGEVERENEKELMLRIGAGYGFPLGEASIGPAVFADFAGDRWTIVYGVTMVTGF